MNKTHKYHNKKNKYIKSKRQHKYKNTRSKRQYKYIKCTRHRKGGANISVNTNYLPLLVDKNNVAYTCTPVPNT